MKSKTAFSILAALMLVTMLFSANGLVRSQDATQEPTAAAGG